MQDISKEQVWALRHAAANGSLTGPLATVALCDNLLAAQKERDEAHRNLENIKAAREEDAIKVLSDVREAAGAPKMGSLVEYVGDMRRMLKCSAEAHAQIREAAGVAVGQDIVNHIAVIRNSADRAADEKLAVRQILDAEHDETMADAAQRVSKEAEGLYRFKLRIREALGVPQGTDMAEAIRKMKRGFNSEIDERVEDFRAVARRAFRQDSIICDIGRIVGAKDLTADGVLAHVKSLPQTVDELRSIARNGLGYTPAFLAVGRCEGLADDVLRKNLEAEIRSAVARGTGSPFMRDTLYQLCEEAGIAWPGDKLEGVDNIRKAISSFVKARMAEIGFLETQCKAASTRAKDAESKAEAVKLPEHLLQQASAWMAVNSALREHVRDDWKGSQCERALRAIRDLAVKAERADRHNDAMMRQNLAEKTAALELAGKRIQELESTIRANLADLEAIEELQEEQAKLVATIIRMAEGKRNPAVTVTSKNASPQVNRLGVRLVLDPNVSRNTWGFLF